MKNKKFIIASAIVIVLLIGLIIFLAIKLHKDNEKKNKDSNYSIVFDYLVDNKVDQRVTFIYKDKILTDITISLFFDEKDVAKAVYNEYKANKEFKKYECKGKKVILYYKDSDLKKYKTYKKDEIINEFTAMGYILKD